MIKFMIIFLFLLFSRLSPWQRHTVGGTMGAQWLCGFV